MAWFRSTKNLLFTGATWIRHWYGGLSWDEYWVESGRGIHGLRRLDPQRVTDTKDGVPLAIGITFIWLLIGAEGGGTSTCAGLRRIAL